MTRKVVKLIKKALLGDWACKDKAKLVVKLFY